MNSPGSEAGGLATANGHGLSALPKKEKKSFLINGNQNCKVFFWLVLSLYCMCVCVCVGQTPAST